MGGLLEHAVDSFLDSHVLRIALPTGVTAAVAGDARSSGDVIDINLGRAIGEGESVSILLLLHAVTKATAITITYSYYRIYLINSIQIRPIIFLISSFYGLPTIFVTHKKFVLYTVYK